MIAFLLLVVLGVSSSPSWSDFQDDRSDSCAAVMLNMLEIDVDNVDDVDVNALHLWHSAGGGDTTPFTSIAGCSMAVLGRDVDDMDIILQFCIL